MDLVDALSAARMAWLDALSSVPPQGWDRSSRCGGWSRRDVATHVLDLSVRLVLRRGGADPAEAARWQGADHLGADPVTRAGIATWELLHELAGPGQLAGHVALPAGTVGAEWLAQRAALELAAHAWDLAVPGTSVDAELAAYLLPLAGTLAADPDPLGDGRWGAPLPDDPAAPVGERLLARLGRRG